MMLEATDIEVGYGRKQVLFGASLRVAPGEIVALIGPNGSGKSTMLKSICGLLTPWRGDVRLLGERTNGSSPARNVARGLAYVPQGSRVFDDMTVRENLQMGGIRLGRRELEARIDETLALFPALEARLRHDAGRLSGGEQQMVAIGRALIMRPKLLLLDEPSLGLSPALVSDVLERIGRVSREREVTVLMVEQKVREALALCRRVYCLRLGRNVWEGTPEETAADPGVLKRVFL